MNRRFACGTPFVRHGALFVVAAATLLTAITEPTRGEDPVPGLVAKRPAEGPFIETPHGFMVPYTGIVPGTEVKFEMVPIPGGIVRVGSPDSEPGRQAQEGPQFEVEVGPFWMGKYEVTWSEYQRFMALYEVFKQFQAQQVRQVNSDNTIDAITAPTPLYEASHTYKKGQDLRHPAVTMSQYAAKQYTKWLSLTSGLFYRLPSEAEWEHACRAGTTTAYSFGDDPSQLDDYAWHAGNSGEQLNHVGLKKPNPWGLYDMHGNVAEWTLDELFEDGYARFPARRLKGDEGIGWPTRLFPRVVRGGHWASPPAECRSASRLGSHKLWRDIDPNLPKSPWWFTDDPARGIGMRLMRQLEIPDRATREKFWEADVEAISLDVELRLEEGRGVLGLVDPALIEAIREAQK